MVDRSVEIRRAGHADLPEIAALASEIWRAHYPSILSREQIEYMLGWMYSLETLQSELRDRGVRFERLLVDDTPAGFAAYGPDAELEACKLHKLYVKPELHGLGLGSRLLRHCEVSAVRLGAHRMTLSVNKRNDRAIQVYRRNGYATIDSVVVDIGGGFVMDDYIMSKWLP